jgi:hypothetical protein
MEVVDLDSLLALSGVIRMSLCDFLIQELVQSSMLILRNY